MTEPDDKTRLRDLQRVLDISRAMTAAKDLDELLGLILDRSMELLGAERATVFLYDAATDELVSRIACGSEEIRMPAGRGVAGACVRERAAVNVPDAYADARRETLKQKIAREGDLSWQLARLEAEWLELTAAFEDLDSA